MVADIEEVEEMDASELHARRLNAKEVLMPMRGYNFFPVADGTVNVSGGDQRLRTSTLIRERPERGEEQRVFRGESDELSSPNFFQDDSTRDDEETKNDFWSITGDFIYRHHVEPERTNISYSNEVFRRHQNNIYITGRFVGEKQKLRNAKKYRAIYHMNYRIGLGIQSLVDESSAIKPQRNPERGHRDTSSSSHEVPMESRANAQPGSGKHSVHTHFVKDPNCDICLKTKNHKVPLQKTHWRSRTSC